MFNSRQPAGVVAANTDMSGAARFAVASLGGLWLPPLGGMRHRRHRACEAYLFRTFDGVDLFDRVVAENGAVLYEPASGSTQLLGQAAPAALVAALTARGVPISVGHAIVATVEPFEHEVLNAIRDLNLEWHVIFNKGAVMALPADITKATGLAPALAELGVDPLRTIGVGDAENDQAFLRLCGLSVAVANALPTVKELADVVTAGARGAGVVELIDDVLAGRLRSRGSGSGSGHEDH